MRIFIKCEYQGFMGQFGTISVPVLASIDIFHIILPIKEKSGTATQISIPN